jgi:putative DNA primase/helicase
MINQEKLNSTGMAPTMLAGISEPDTSSAPSTEALGKGAGGGATVSSSESSGTQTAEADKPPESSKPTASISRLKRMAFEPLHVISARELIDTPVEPRPFLLKPWLPEKGVALIYARPGFGKTLLALAVSYAVATGSAFLHWRAPQPRRVLYLDGEMSRASMQDRVAAIEAGGEQKVDPDFLRFICADTQGQQMPDLGTGLEQIRLAPYLEGVDLIVVDNISTLVRCAAENDAESWKPVQRWVLDQRRANRSVLFVHHANKRGGSRGTSRREDVADTVISLTRPDDYEATEAARFVIKFEKARGFTGEDVEPLEARYETVAGAARWTWKPLVDEVYERATDLFEQGGTVRAIAADLGVSKSVAGRLRQRWQDEKNETDNDETEDDQEE